MQTFWPRFTIGSRRESGTFGMLEDLSLLTAEDVRSIDKDIAEQGFSVRRPPSLMALCEAARIEYLDVFQKADLQPPRKKFSYTDLARAPWRKLAIGSQNGVGETYAQVLQTIYFDCRHSPNRALNALFSLHE